MTRQSISEQVNDVLTGEADTLFEWVVAITLGYIIAHFFIELFQIEEYIEIVAEQVRTWATSLWAN